MYHIALHSTQGGVVSIPAIELRNAFVVQHDPNHDDRGRWTSCSRSPGDTTDPSPVNESLYAVNDDGRWSGTSPRHRSPSLLLDSMVGHEDDILLPLPGSTRKSSKQRRHTKSNRSNYLEVQDNIPKTVDHFKKRMLTSWPATRPAVVVKPFVYGFRQRADPPALTLEQPGLSQNQDLAPCTEVSVAVNPTISASSEGAIGVALAFIQCACCFEDVDVSQKQFTWKCDAFGMDPHRICSQCAERFLWSCFETGGLSRLSVTKQKSCRFPCLSPTGCDGLIHVSLPSLFASNECAIDLFTRSGPTVSGSITDAATHVLEQHRHTTTRLEKQKGVSRNPTPDPLQDLAHSIRHGLIDRLTSAWLRRCPTCRQPFVKTEDGCNKIRCPNCHTTSCYCCRREVTDYKHFANYKGMDETSLLLCPLWTSDAIDRQRDEQRLQDTIFNEANQVWEEYLVQNLSS